MGEGPELTHPHVAHYDSPEEPAAADPGAEVRDREYVESAEDRMLLRRFAVLRYVLATLFTVVAVSFFASALSGVVVAIDAAGEPEVSMLRLTEGGSPAGYLVAYGTFVAITAIIVVLEILSIFAAVFFLRVRLRPTAWKVIAVVAIVGTGAAIWAFMAGGSSVELWLSAAVVAYAALGAASLFELWRIRWVQQRLEEAPTS